MFIITVLDICFSTGKLWIQAREAAVLGGLEWSLVFSRDPIRLSRCSSEGMISQLLAHGGGAMCVLLLGIHVFPPLTPTARILRLRPIFSSGWANELISACC